MSSSKSGGSSVGAPTVEGTPRAAADANIVRDASMIAA
jgi:hypothetical protein